MEFLIYNFNFLIFLRISKLLLIKVTKEQTYFLLRNLSKEQLKLEFMHPEHGKKFNLVENIGIYAWHCNHHLGHVNNAITFEGKFI